MSFLPTADELNAIMENNYDAKRDKQLVKLRDELYDAASKGETGIVFLVSARFLSYIEKELIEHNYTYTSSATRSPEKFKLTINF